MMLFSEFSGFFDDSMTHLQADSSVTAGLFWRGGRRRLRGFRGLGVGPTASTLGGSRAPFHFVDTQSLVPQSV